MGKCIAVFGGDLRQVRLAQLLQENGWEVVSWGLERGDAPNPVSLERVISADYIVLPLPVLRGERLNLPLANAMMTPAELWSRLRPEQLLLGGAVGTLAETLRGEYGLELVDYYDREDVQIANAVPTAEGAIMRMMEETEYTVQGSRCLVIGYGRIGKALAQRLQALGALVTVSARNHPALAWSKACGFRAVMTDALAQKVGEYDVIFNTAPARVMDAQCIAALRPDTLLVELASLPGGFDEAAVKEHHLHIIVERGLPAKSAPMSAARAIRDGIEQILEERGYER